MKENVFEVAPNRVWIIGYTPRALLTSLHCPKWGGMRRIHPLKVWGLKEGVYKLAKSALKILSPHLGKWGDLKCHPEIDMKIWSLYQRLLCKWFLKSLWIIYSEVYLKEEMTYSYIVSWTHTVIFYFFFFLFSPSSLKRSSEDYESVESHVINKGSGVGMEVTGKQTSTINTQQATETTKQAELNCWAKSWLEIFFLLGMSEILSGL